MEFATINQFLRSKNLNQYIDWKDHSDLSKWLSETGFVRGPKLGVAFTYQIADLDRSIGTKRLLLTRLLNIYQELKKTPRRIARQAEIIEMLKEPDSVPESPTEKLSPAFEFVSYEEFEALKSRVAELETLLGAVT